LLATAFKAALILMTLAVGMTLANTWIADYNASAATFTTNIWSLLVAAVDAIVFAFTDFAPEANPRRYRLVRAQASGGLYHLGTNDMVQILFHRQPAPEPPHREFPCRAAALVDVERRAHLPRRATGSRSAGCTSRISSSLL
jgi:hypothetical protein